MTDKLVCRDGFDAYNGMGIGLGMGGNWVFDSYYAVQRLVAGRFGGQAYQTFWSGSVQWSAAKRVFDEPVTRFSVGFAFNLSALEPAPFAWMLDGGNFQLSFRTDSDGYFYVCRSTDWDHQADLGKSPSPCMLASTWQYVVVTGTIGADETVMVHVDGELVMTLTHVDTDNAGSGSADRIWLGYRFTYTSRTYDDLVVRNFDTPLLPLRVYLAPVTSDGSHQDFVPLSGTSNVAMVNQIPADSSEYVSGSNVGDYDEYGIHPITDAPYFIYEVNLLAAVEKTDASARAISLGVDSGGTVVDSANLYLTDSGNFVNVPLGIDPNGNTPWVKDAVNALVLRPKITV